MGAAEGPGRARTPFTRHNLWRGLYLLTLFAFLLPFVAVKGCAKGSPTVVYRGYQLITDPHRSDFISSSCYIVAISLALLFLSLSFVRRPSGEILQGFLRSGKAFLSAMAGCIVLLVPTGQFLFDKVEARAGQVLACAAWGLVFGGCVVGAARSALTVRHLDSCAVPKPPGIFQMLGLLQYVFAVLFWVAAFSGSACCLFDKLPRYDAAVEVFLLASLFSLSASLAVHFVALGLRYGQRWAAIWCASTSLFLAVVGVLASVGYCAGEYGWVVPLVTLPLTAFLAVVGFRALAIVKRGVGKAAPVHLAS